MNFANIIHKIFKIKLYNNNLYINPGFLCGLLMVLCGIYKNNYFFKIFIPHISSPLGFVLQHTFHK